MEQHHAPLGQGPVHRHRGYPQGQWPAPFGIPVRLRGHPSGAGGAGAVPVADTGGTPSRCAGRAGTTVRPHGGKRPGRTADGGGPPRGAGNLSGSPDRAGLRRAGQFSGGAGRTESGSALPKPADRQRPVYPAHPLRPGPVRLSGGRGPCRYHGIFHPHGPAPLGQRRQRCVKGTAGGNRTSGQGP